MIGSSPMNSSPLCAGAPPAGCRPAGSQSESAGGFGNKEDSDDEQLLVGACRKHNRRHHSVTVLQAEEECLECAQQAEAVVRKQIQAWSGQGGSFYSVSPERSQKRTKPLHVCLLAVFLDHQSYSVNRHLLYFSLTWLSSSLVLCSSVSRLSMQTTVCSRFWWRSAFSSCNALSKESHSFKQKNTETWRITLYKTFLWICLNHISC